jgi:hypothetical protein
VSNPKKKSVSPAAAPSTSTEVIKPADDSVGSSGVPKSEATGQAPNAAVAPKTISISALVKDIDESKLQMAEGLGIPIRGILSWAYTIEQNVIALNNGMTQLGVDLKPLVDAVKARQPAGPQTNPSQGGQPNLMALAQQFGPGILQAITGGGSNDAFYNAFQQKVLDRALSSMDSDAAIGKAIKDQIVSKLAAQVVTSATGA